MFRILRPDYYGGVEKALTDPEIAMLFPRAFIKVRHGPYAVVVPWSSLLTLRDAISDWSRGCRKAFAID